MRVARLLPGLLVLAGGLALAQESEAPLDPSATPLDPVMARPPMDVLTESDRKLRAVQESLPDLGERAPRWRSYVERAAEWALLPSDPVPMDAAAQLSAEEHLRNSGRSREQLP